ncbi:MAG: hypothetical protein K940chlam9_00459 [Chlamydiae bacterium]|nr:hypothetical protein [Chlamydiota bacterium]
MPIADLHCDLLAYLASEEGRTIFDPDPHCSLPQLQEGGVNLQTLAIYTETGKKSVALAEKQFTIFRTLPKLYPEAFAHLQELKIPTRSKKIHIVAAIENASGLCGEGENLENAFTRLDQYRESAGPLLYLSLTWNQENRFGGGNQSKAGLKVDGERMLDYLDGSGISIDLSHTSDALASDILNYLDKKRLSITPIASHSNFRKICNHPRNLTDEIAKEIFDRGGVIGLNFFKMFVGKTFPDDFMRQVDYARSIGGFRHLCLGADYFYDKDFPLILQPFVPFFYPPFGDASTYPAFFAYLNERFTQAELKKLAYQNLASFFLRERKKR